MISVLLGVGAGYLLRSLLQLAAIRLNRAESYEYYYGPGEYR